MIADANAAEKRNSLRQQREENLVALPKLAVEAQVVNDRVKALKIEKATAKAEADDARALVEEFKARLAKAEGGLAMKTAKLEGVTSDLAAAKAKQASLATEGNRLLKL